jgi:transposase InsO family protein
MPWQECSIMSQRLEFVLLARQEDANHSALCRRYGISRKTGYKWLARYDEDGEAGLTDRSRRPHQHPAQTPPDLEAALLAVRTAHPAWGGRKIKAWLERRGMMAPSPSTITAILERNRLLDDPSERPQRSWQRFEAAAPNDLWQLDFKGVVRLGTGKAFPLSVLDDHSRFAVGLFACADQKQPTVQTHLTRLFRRYGLPRRILTDNGPPWGPSRQYGMTALEAWWLRLGIKVSHGRIYHPQTQGKVERFHGSLTAEVLRGPQLLDQAACQHAFDRWRDCYNLERPHEALALGVPVERYTPSPRPLPAVVPAIVYGPEDAVRMVKRHGVIAYRGRRYFISRGLAGLPVAVRRTRDPALVQVYFCQQLVKEVTLHPSAVDA